jgi:hypothetical protein
MNYPSLVLVLLSPDALSAWSTNWWMLTDIQTDAAFNTAAPVLPTTAETASIAPPVFAYSISTYMLSYCAHNLCHHTLGGSYTQMITLLEQGCVGEQWRGGGGGEVRAALDGQDHRGRGHRQRQGRRLLTTPALDTGTAY